jgi:hypothetical protein
MNKDDCPRIVAFLALAVCLLLSVSSFAQQYIAPDYPPPPTSRSGWSQLSIKG